MSTLINKLTSQMLCRNNLFDIYCNIINACVIGSAAFHCYRGLQMYNKVNVINGVFSTYSHDRMHSFDNVVNNAFTGFGSGIIIGLGWPVVLPVLGAYYFKSKISKD